MTDTTTLIQRLREDLPKVNEPESQFSCVATPDIRQAADALEQQAAALAEKDAEIARLRADEAVWKEQVDSLRNALVKVLDTRNKEAKATMSYQTARENFSDSTDERKAQERAMLAASDAERDARTLLLTLKKIPDAALRQEQPAGEGEK